MPPKITTRFADDGGTDLIHKIRNFAEDVFCEFEKTGLVDMGGLDGADSVTSVLRIEIRKATKIGTVRKGIVTLLKRHFLFEVATITFE